ncbi:MAG TPA: hypothetical protein VNO81_13675 [Candidatus Nitrosotenuis sp.]|jgi:hypothetical protein|nr:hypothetical protein [Candidatus Nitrosotenuis sp.]
MRRILAGFILALCLSAGTLAAPTPPPDYFPLAEGYWWKYRSTTSDNKTSEFTVKVLKWDRQSGLYQVETTTSWQTIHDWYSKPQGWVLMHRQAYPKNNMESNFDPVRQWLQNPLARGATWSWKGTGMMGVDIEETSTVSGPETVEVPAGKFSAMRVDTQMKQGGQEVKKTYWYANWVGMVKSMTESGNVKSTTVLLDYSFKDKS